MKLLKQLYLPGVKPATGSLVSYQNRSPNLIDENCLLRIQEKVGPKRPLPSGSSEMAPLNTSMSSGSLLEIKITIKMNECCYHLAQREIIYFYLICGL